MSPLYRMLSVSLTVQLLPATYLFTQRQSESTGTVGNGLAAMDLATDVEKWFRPEKPREGCRPFYSRSVDGRVAAKGDSTGAGGPSIASGVPGNVMLAAPQS